MSRKLLVISVCLLLISLFSSFENASEAQSFKGEELTVLYMSAVYADAARDIEKEFEEATGAKVNVIDFPYSGLHEKIMLDLTSNTGIYDVISVPCQWLGEAAPFLQPLDSYIKRDNYDIDDYIEHMLDVIGTWQETVYTIPHANTTQMLTYRTDLVAEDELPETWDEYLEIAKKFTNPSEGMYGISTPAQKTQFGSLWCTRLWSMGGEWADEDWNITIDSEPARKALNHVKEMLNYTDPAALSWGLPESINAFIEGKAVFCEAWPTLGVLQQADDPERSKIVGKWALATFPYEKTGATNIGAWGLGINSDSKNKELAWEWVKMYTSKENQVRFAEKFNFYPVTKSFWNREEIKNSQLYKMIETLDKGMIWWRIPASFEAKTAIDNAVGSYMVGEMSLDAAIKYAENELKKALKSYPPPEGLKNDNAILIKEFLKE